jgi:all-trans-retinol 13,14-reductase
VDWLQAEGLDPRVFLGASLRLQSPLEEVSLHEYAHIAYHFMNGSWRLEGGGRVLAQALCDDICSRGGSVLTRKEVVEINGLADGNCRVSCADGSTYEGRVVSDIHPLETAALVRPGLRPSYLKRLSILKNGSGIFTCYIKLKQKQIRYVDHAISIDGMLLHFGQADEEGYALSLDLMTHVGETVTDRDGLAKKCISQASACIGGLEHAVEAFWTSTPDTWRRFTGTPEGSAYGILKRCSELSVCVVSPRTPLPGLFLTGQNLGLHGVLGVSYTAVRTCSVILGADIINQMFDFAQ